MGSLVRAPFIVLRDNNPHAYLGPGKLGAVEQCRDADLAPYNFTMKYCSGKENLSADTLSWNLQDSSVDDMVDVLQLNILAYLHVFKP